MKDSINIFTSNDPESVYEYLISLGKTLPLMKLEDKTEENRVLGCQSEMYISYELLDGKLFFYCDSEALISKGIAAFCIKLLNGKTPFEILQDPLQEIQKINLPLILSPSRSNGLKSLIQKIKNLALKEYVIEESSKKI
jgi:cysteine desulfuration protein SufE